MQIWAMPREVNGFFIDSMQRGVDCFGRVKPNPSKNIDVLLERDSVAAEDAEGLAKQLDALNGALNDATIAAAADGANRGFVLRAFLA